MPTKFQANVLLKKFTSFKIGGFAKYFTCIKNSQEAISAFRFAKNNNLNFLVIGKGSNILIDSKGYNGLVILNRIDHLSFNGSCIKVGSGYRYPHLAHKTIQRGLAGLEFAINIPATVGGAIFMNAGANGYETSDHLEEIVFLTADLKLINLKKSEMNFSYRRSLLQNIEGIIIEAVFNLNLKSKSKEFQRDLINYRLKTQPLKSNSAGCIFQNPSKDISAGYLIEKCNLKKAQIGGAVVSEKHANFIINSDDATSDDVLSLINYINEVVKRKTGYFLKTEVRYIPYV